MGASGPCLLAGVGAGSSLPPKEVARARAQGWWAQSHQLCSIEKVTRGRHSPTPAVTYCLG